MKRIFIDVDTQEDFCNPSGSLYVKGTPLATIKKIVNFALENKIPILGSVDSHFWDAWEFASNSNLGPNGIKPNFPDHCIKGTFGWLKIPETLPPRSKFIPQNSIILESLVDELISNQTQGIYFEKEVYSLFANPSADIFFEKLYQKINTTKREVECLIFGVATDYCVKEAALGLISRGVKTTVITDGIAGITPEGTEEALKEMNEAGVEFTTFQVLSKLYEK